MIKYIHLVTILAAVYLPDFAVWAMPVLAFINLTFSVMFYWLTFQLMAGLKNSEIHPEIDVAEAWTSRAIQITGTLILIMSGEQVYQYIAMFSMAWVVTNVITDAFATLLKWEILAIEENPDNDD